MTMGDATKVMIRDPFRLITENLTNFFSHRNHRKCHKSFFLKEITENVTLSKGPATLKSLVKLRRICGVRVLPGVQMDSKVDHNSPAK